METTHMTGFDGTKVRSQISLVKGAWVVTIYNGSHTENRSFRNEIDARDYGKARIDQLRSAQDNIRIDPKVT
jgi:hypothetical protein